MTLDELDRLAAEKIMGWVGFREEYVSATNKPEPEFESYIRAWRPTRNIAQAWECLEKFPAFQLFGRYPQVRLRFECIIYTRKDKVFSVEAATAPEAIVRACLKAKGVEND